MEEEIITVEVATEKHLKYVDEILKTIEDAAKVRGTGIAKRRPESLGLFMRLLLLLLRNQPRYRRRSDWLARNLGLWPPRGIDIDMDAALPVLVHKRRESIPNADPLALSVSISAHKGHAAHKGRVDKPRLPVALLEFLLDSFVDLGVRQVAVAQIIIFLDLHAEALRDVVRHLLHDFPGLFDRQRPSYATFAVPNLEAV